MKDPSISLDSPYIDLISAIKDPNVKEIIAKEALQYKPKMEEPKNVKVLENMVEVIKNVELHSYDSQVLMSMLSRQKFDL